MAEGGIKEEEGKELLGQESEREYSAESSPPMEGEEVASSGGEEHEVVSSTSHSPDPDNPLAIDRLLARAIERRRRTWMRGRGVDPCLAPLNPIPRLPRDRRWRLQEGRGRRPATPRRPNVPSNPHRLFGSPRRPPPDNPGGDGDKQEEEEEEDGWESAPEGWESAPDGWETAPEDDDGWKTAPEEL